MGPGLVVQPGYRQFRAEFVQRFGAAPGDRLWVGDAHYQASFASQGQVIREAHAGVS
ncbi:hypothetical protein L912_3988 [Escherichia coli SCD1]|nr:hypothetical protein L912_3988 [Escherichia coli SCD1]